MSLVPKDNTNLLVQKPYTFPPKHYAWIRKELTELKKEDIISPSFPYFTYPNINLPNKKDPATH